MNTGIKQISCIVVCMGLASAMCSTAEVECLRILPLGDSITQGGKSGRDEYTYRLPLARLLKEAGISFDFIGSHRRGLNEDFSWPEGFDGDHEGHYGWKTAAVRDHLPEWMERWNGVPDLVLLHLGFNDQDPEGSYEVTIAEPMRDIIRLLRQANPDVVVLVGHLGLNDGEGLRIRPVVEAMAVSMHTPKSPVVTVPHYDGWVENPALPGTDTFDWAHPNPQGQQKMADNWFRSMQPFLTRASSEGAAVPVTVRDSSQPR
jgi:acyl-CoA thioesterase I